MLVILQVLIMAYIPFGWIICLTLLIKVDGIIFRSVDEVPIHYLIMDVMRWMYQIGVLAVRHQMVSSFAIADGKAVSHCHLKKKNNFSLIIEGRHESVINGDRRRRGSTLPQRSSFGQNLRLSPLNEDIMVYNSSREDSTLPLLSYCNTKS